MTERVLLGHCAVDSGQIILVDPCYVDEDDGIDYRGVCEVSLSDQRGGEFLFAGIGGTGVVTSTGYGDGSYPVYAEMVDGRVSRVTIEFMEEGDPTVEYAKAMGL